MVELPSEVSLSTADFNHMYSNSFFIASAGCPPAKISQHLKRTTRDREKQTYIQSDLKDLTDDLILPDIIVKRRRGNVSFLPGWNVRGRSWRFSGLRSRRWRRGLRFERGRWRRRWGRRGRGRRRSSRGRRLQLCQPLHADLRKRLSKYRIRTRAVSAVRTRSASLVGSVKDWLELMITVDARVLYLVGAADPQSGLYNHPYPFPFPFRHHDHVCLCALLHCTTGYRVITPSILFFSNALVSEAENSLGVKKKVACIGLRCLQACQQRSIRSVRRL
jgi:hypothetical protein